MNGEALTRSRFANDEGNPNAMPREREEEQSDDNVAGSTLETNELFVPFDLGRQRLFTGHTAMRGFAPEFHTDRIIPRRLIGPVIAGAFVGSDNYIG